MQNMDIMKLMDKFGTDDACREVLEEMRWPDGVTCPQCQSKSISRVEKLHIFDCNSCRHQFSVTSGTMFHDSHLPLRKWFVAIFLIVESKKGMSANQLKRVLGVSYKTAWYLCHRIRAAMTNGTPELLRGIIEIDETWVGGRRKHVGHGFKGNKVIVVGAAEREGKITLKVIDRADRATLHNFIKTNTDPNAEAIFTDEWPAYKGIADENTRHETVNHSIEEWVNGEVHTNSIENVWSLLKRSIMGSYHKVSVKHLDAYLDELEWRFNNRENDYLFRDTLQKLIGSENLTYHDLTSQ